MRSSNIKIKDLEKLTEILRARNIDILAKDGVLKIISKGLFKSSKILEMENNFKRIISQILTDLDFSYNIEFGNVTTTKNQETEFEIFL